ncbi:MAG TPA: zinc-finger domain-containing protein [Bacillaceae bacterium]
MERIAVLKEIDELMYYYCEDCFLKKHFRKAYSNTYAHSFCISQCTVGGLLREKGKSLLK